MPLGLWSRIKVRNFSFLHFVKGVANLCYLARVFVSLLTFVPYSISDIMDTSRNGNYYLKGKVAASMRNEFRNVHITISIISGAVLDASCTCPAAALGMVDVTIVEICRNGLRRKNVPTCH
jgi:hypothetical protein